MYNRTQNDIGNWYESNIPSSHVLWHNCFALGLVQSATSQTSPIVSLNCVIVAPNCRIVLFIVPLHSFNSRVVRFNCRAVSSQFWSLNKKKIDYTSLNTFFVINQSFENCLWKITWTFIYVASFIQSWWSWTSSSVCFNDVFYPIFGAASPSTCCGASFCCPRSPLTINYNYKIDLISPKILIVKKLGMKEILVTWTLICVASFIHSWWSCTRSSICFNDGFCPMLGVTSPSACLSASLRCPCSPLTINFTKIQTI